MCVLLVSKVIFYFFKTLFYFLKDTHKKNTGTYNTQQMHLSIKLEDYGLETKILNSIPYISSTSDKISNIKCE